MSENKECMCSMRIKMVGSGCQYCNPDLARELSKVKQMTPDEYARMKGVSVGRIRTLCKQIQDLSRFTDGPSVYRLNRRKISLRYCGDGPVIKSVEVMRHGKFYLLAVEL